jgi:hypothetical protein
MAEQCFKKVDPKSTVCGVHYVPLVQDRVPIDQFAPHVGQIVCLRCPVSRDVVQEAPGFWKQEPI